MKSLVYFLGCGRIELGFRNSTVFAVTKISEITDVIIPFFNKYNILGNKVEDFND
jgi:hypothetical protein